MMNKLLFSFLVWVLLFSTMHLHANSVAQFLYEDAEAAVARQDFSTALQKLAESEKALGKVNGSILYLRIVARNELLQRAGDRYVFEDVESLRKDSALFTEKYFASSNPQQAREVYRISEDLKKYPSDKNAYLAKKNAELLRSKNYQQLFANLTEAEKQPGWSWTEAHSVMKILSLNALVNPPEEKPMEARLLHTEINAFHAATNSAANISNDVLKLFSPMSAQQVQETIAAASKRTISIDEYLLAADALHAKNYEVALEVLNKLTAAGNIEAKKLLGLVYLDGLGVEKDVVKALPLLQEAATFGILSPGVLVLTRIAESLVKIPAGVFKMGSKANSSEKPMQTVTVNSFYIMEHEVTWAQYQPCIDAGVCNRASDSGFGKADRPVINVNWEDVQIYIGWLNQQTGKRFRLPSEAEWEYAARAGSNTDYHWGNSINCSQARYGRRSGGECSNSGDGSVPVKSFKPNAFGLYDMHGNVWEWVQDCWNDSYRGAPTNGSAWQSGDCSKRVLRGGSWGDTPGNLRSANRDRPTASGRNYYIGFRLVQDR